MICSHAPRRIKGWPFALAAACALFIATTRVQAANFTKGRQVAPLSRELKAGDYEWHPAVSPSGPVVILISLPNQEMYVYRNGVRIGRSTVSTGSKGHRTPTGVFTVLQRKVAHESSIYKGAKMPHMQRLTWTGIAMHAGNLPGYPASHGCVRLPEQFAEKLYSVTSIGTTVIIADSKSSSGMTSKPGLVFTASKREPVQPGVILWKPADAPRGPVSIIISTADRDMYVYRNGVEIGRAPLTGYGRISGTHAYSALATVDANGQRDWMAVVSAGGRRPDLKKIATHLGIDPGFLGNVRAMITTGTSLIITDTPVDRDTQSGKGLSIMTAS